jgi:hypothetical protein
MLWLGWASLTRRLIRTINEEEVDLSEHECYNNTVFHRGRFPNGVYMCKPIHSLLGYITPAELEERWPHFVEQAAEIQGLIGFYAETLKPMMLVTA